GHVALGPCGTLRGPQCRSRLPPPRGAEGAGAPGRTLDRRLTPSALTDPAARVARPDEGARRGEAPRIAVSHRTPRAIERHLGTGSPCRPGLPTVDPIVLSPTPVKFAGNRT